MTDIVEIKGDWIGYYTFDNGYTESDKRQRIPFRLTIERGINEFVGRVYEEVDHGGIDDDIVIQGRQNGDEIEFAKYYTLQHFTDEGNNLVSMESEHPTVVYYKGRYDHATSHFRGEWEIPALREDDDGVFHAANYTGFWVIWREAPSTHITE